MAEREQLVEALDNAVQETLAYFGGAGRETAARVANWGGWEVLAHFLYWHDATGWGIASANIGGPPWQLSAGADETNAAALALHAGESFDDLIAQLRAANTRLLRAARAATNIEAPAFRFGDGRLISIGQRLETIARHWSGHVQALREAGG